jgi:hypothetical protein
MDHVERRPISADVVTHNVTPHAERPLVGPALRRKPRSRKVDNRGTVFVLYDIMSYQVFIEHVPWL